MGDTQSEARVLFEARGLSKTFGPNRVLSDVSLTVRAGEVRALLGQNGSGKSTLIKLVTGVHAPDPGGAVTIAGRELSLPLDTRSPIAGLGVMHQDLALVESYSILDNFLLDGSTRPLRRIRWRGEAERVTRALELFGLDVDVRNPIGQLTRSERAVVAMARAFSRLGGQQGLLILDEPTAPLERNSVEMLFSAIDRIRERGCGVLYVSHDMAEVRHVCDTATVLRDGEVVAEGALDQLDDETLVRAIVGKALGSVYPEKAVRQPTRAVLSVRGLSGERVSDLSFDLHEGEILGITGLAGMGQDSVPGLVFGASRHTQGTIELYGREIDPTPRSSIEHGVVLLPADRKALGGDMAASLVDNLAIASIDRYFRGGRIRRGEAFRAVSDAIEEFGVRPCDPLRSLGELSGGNQQKALLAKWMRVFGSSRVFLLHEPTQGVDIGARQEIFRLVADAASRGQSFLYVSSEYEDLANLCDRVLVMRYGRAVGDLARSELSAQALAVHALMTTSEEALR